MLRKCVVLVTMLVGALSLSADDQDPIRDKLSAAKSAYDAELIAVRKQTEDWFDKREEAARKAGDKKLIDQLKTERAEYEGTRELPKGTPAAIRARQDKALKALEAAYGQAVKDYTKAKKDAEAAAVETELKNVKAQIKAVSLLALVNPKVHALAGEWKKEDGRLTADKAARLQFPFEPGEEYDLSVTCRRESGTEGLEIGLVAGGRQVLMIVDGWPRAGFISGLDLVDGKDASNNATAVKGKLLKADEDNVIVASVRSGKIEISVNGKRVISYAGDFARLGCPERSVPRNKKALFLVFGPDATFRIDNVTVIPVKGKGTLLK